MNRVLHVIAMLLLATADSLAQGQFFFGNKVLVATPPIDARMYTPDCVTPLAGDAYLSQAYVKLAEDPDSSYASVGVAVPFRTGVGAGYIVTHVVTTPYPGWTPVAVEMRVWEAAGGPTYEEAQAAGRFYGKSAPVSLTVTVAPATPPDMVGLQSFCLIPEPSTLALGALGAAVLGWSVRERKVWRSEARPCGGRGARHGARGGCAPPTRRQFAG